MQGPWYGRGGQGKYIHILPQFLYGFLMAHSEALLFVYYKEAYIWR